MLVLCRGDGKSMERGRAAVRSRVRGSNPAQWGPAACVPAGARPQNDVVCPKDGPICA